MKFDPTVIAFLQIIALVYGVFVLFQARPVYVVFVKDRFDLVTANTIVPESLERVTLEEFKSLPLTGPKVVGSIMPEDPQEREHVLFTSIESGIDLPSYPQYYVPYQDQKELILKQLRSLEVLRKFRPDSEAKLNGLDARIHQRPGNFGFLPIWTPTEHDLTTIVDRSSGEIAAVIDVYPWIEEL